LQIAMSTMVSTCLAAVRQVASLQSVEEEVSTIASERRPTDVTFYKILKAVEHELLPSGDSDDSVLLQVAWHPTSVGTHVVRTAYALLSKLRAYATSNQEGGNDTMILKYFRIHVEKAASLSGLICDSTGRSLPRLIYGGYLTTEMRPRYSTVVILSKALKEPSSIGMSPLLFTPVEESSRPRRGLHPPPQTPAQAAAAARQEEEESVAAEALALQRSPGGGNSDAVTVPRRSPQEQHYIDLPGAWAVVPPLKIRIPSQSGNPAEARYVPLPEISAEPPEIWNPNDPTGRGEYGASDIGHCPVCVLVHPGADLSMKVAEFIAQNHGMPTGVNGPRPVPPNVTFSHHFDQCRHFWYCIDNACSRGRAPLALAVSLDRAERARRLAASKARAEA
jgi:hypothetical protein